MSDKSSHLKPCCAKAVNDLLQIFRRQLAEERKAWHRERAEDREQARLERVAMADLFGRIISEADKRILERSIHATLEERERAGRHLRRWEQKTGKRIGGGFHVKGEK